MLLQGKGGAVSGGQRLQTERGLRLRVDFQAVRQGFVTVSCPPKGCLLSGFLLRCRPLLQERGKLHPEVQRAGRLVSGVTGMLL